MKVRAASPLYRVHQRSSSSTNTPADQFRPSSAEELDFDKARRVLFPEKPIEPGNPQLLWKVERANSLPWIGPQGEMFLGYQGRQSSPFEGTVAFLTPQRAIERTVKVRGKVSRQPVAVKDRLLVCLNDPYHLQALNPATGEVMWDVPNILGPLEVNDEQLFGRTYQQELTRIHPDSGGRMWATKTEGVPLKIHSTPRGVLAGSRVSHQTGEGRVGLFDADTGALKWQRSCYRHRFTEDDQAVYAANERGDQIEVLDPTNGETVRTLSVPGSRWLDPLYSDGDRLMAWSFGTKPLGELVAFDLESGQVAWSYDTGTVSQVIPGRNGLLYTVGESKVHCFDSKSGHPIWKGHSGHRAEMDVTPEGTVLTRDQFGNLRAFATPDVKEKALESGDTFEFEFREDEVVVGDFTLPRQD